jgi:hypothetical protein
MNLTVKTSGPTTGAPVLFLHGGGLSGRMWDPVIAHLPDFFCIAPDLAEHGRSAQISPLTMADSIDQLRTVIHERTPGGWAHVVGACRWAELSHPQCWRAPGSGRAGDRVGRGAAANRVLAWTRISTAPITPPW